MWVDGGDGCAPFIIHFIWNASSLKCSIYHSVGNVYVHMYVHCSYMYDSRGDGDDLPPRLVADPVEGVKGRISTVSSQTGKIL